MVAALDRQSIREVYGGGKATSVEVVDRRQILGGDVPSLLRAIRGVPASGRSARYRCVAALAMPGGGFEHVEGTCEGTLRRATAGSNGFGYDPIFEPVGRDVTMAELADPEKDRISHRGRAFRALREALDRPPS